MSIFRSLTRIVESSLDIVDKTTVRPIADAADLAAESLKGLYPDDEQDRR